METYPVAITTVSFTTVEADSPEEAEEKARDYAGEELIYDEIFEVSLTGNPTVWNR